MAWNAPKTDWDTNPTNPVADDFNRIEENIDFLKTDIETKKGLIVDAINTMGRSVTIANTHVELANAIKDISDDANAAVGDVLQGKTFYQGGAKKIGTIPSKGTATITPGTTNQIIAASQYLSGAQTIAGSANLLPENVKQGVNIFGVVGNYDNSGISKVTASSMINIISPDSGSYPDAVESSLRTPLSSGATFNTSAALLIINGSTSAQFSLTATSNILYRYYSQLSSPVGGTYTGVIGNSIAPSVIPNGHGILVYNPDKASISISRTGGSGTVTVNELII